MTSSYPHGLNYCQEYLFSSWEALFELIEDDDIMIIIFPCKNYTDNKTTIKRIIPLDISHSEISGKQVVGLIVGTLNSPLNSLMMMLSSNIHCRLSGWTEVGSQGWGEFPKTPFLGEGERKL